MNLSTESTESTLRAKSAGDKGNKRLVQLAEQSLEEASDRDEAVRNFLAEARKKNLLTALCRFGAETLIRHAGAQIRQRIEQQMISDAQEKGRGQPRGDGPASRRRNGAWDSLSFYLWPLPIAGQPHLGDATREQVEESAEFYGSMAKDCERKNVWLNAVAKKMQKAKANERVRDRISEETLSALWEEKSR